MSDDITSAAELLSQITGRDRSAFEAAECSIPDVDEQLEAAEIKAARREAVNDVPVGASDEYRAGWIDGIVEFDRRLTDDAYIPDE